MRHPTRPTRPTRPVRLPEPTARPEDTLLALQHLLDAKVITPEEYQGLRARVAP